jgi:hypothetical protein
MGDQETIELSEETVIEIANGIKLAALDNDWHTYDFLAALHVLIEDYKDQGLEIEIAHHKDAMN